MADLEKGTKIEYNIKGEGNGLYVFVLNGDVTVEGQALSTRDGYGLWDTKTVNFSADSNTSLLLMEVPMTV